ncbi:hypothetical protein GE21DRAFT_1114304 [Neurospora crassa]|nr:hypothetical protein GE21DRAFT_1114304 [Neurospora crassa]
METKIHLTGALDARCANRNGSVRVRNCGRCYHTCAMPPTMRRSDDRWGRDLEVGGSRWLRCHDTHATSMFTLHTRQTGCFRGNYRG